MAAITFHSRDRASQENNNDGNNGKITMKKRWFGYFFLSMAILLGLSQPCRSAEKEKDEATFATALLPNAQLLFMVNKEFSSKLLGDGFLDKISLAARINNDKDAIKSLKDIKEGLDLQKHADWLLSVNIMNVYKEKIPKPLDLIKKVEWLLGIELDDDFSYMARYEATYMNNYEVEIVKSIQQTIIESFAKILIDVANELIKSQYGKDIQELVFSKLKIEAPEMDGFKLPDWQVIHTRISYENQEVYEIFWAVSKKFKTIVFGPKDVVIKQLLAKDKLTEVISFKDTPAGKLYSQIKEKPTAALTFSASPEDVKTLNQFVIGQEDFSEKALVMHMLETIKTAGFYTTVVKGNLETAVKLEYHDIVQAKYAYLQIENAYLRKFRQKIDSLDEELKLSCLLGIHEHWDDNVVTVSTMFTPYDLVQLYQIGMKIISNKK